jgi:TolB-like protein
MLMSVSYAESTKNAATKNEGTEKESAAPSMNQDAFIEQLAEELAKSLAKRQKRAVVVADFLSIDGKETAFGKVVTIELATKLINSQGDLAVIPTARLNKTLEREKITSDEITDLEKLQLIKKALRIDSIIVGNIIESNGRTKVNAKIIDVETGSYIGASSIDFTGPARSGIDPVKGTVASATKEEVKQNKGTEKPATKAFAGDFSFEIQSCKQSGQTVTCHIEITDIAESDLLIFFRKNSQIVDENGQTYYMDSVELGNRIASLEQGYPLITKIPVKGLIRFKGVKPDTSQIKLLRFSCRSADSKKMASSRVFQYHLLSQPFDIDFRDIPLSKEK